MDSNLSFLFSVPLLPPRQLCDGSEWGRFLYRLRLALQTVGFVPRSRSSIWTPDGVEYWLIGRYSLSTRITGIRWELADVETATSKDLAKRIINRLAEITNQIDHGRHPAPPNS